jgi:hypothetical protein
VSGWGRRRASDGDYSAGPCHYRTFDLSRLRAFAP